MTNRRKFIKQIASAGIICSIPEVLIPSKQKSSDSKIWAILLQLSVNMWDDYYPDLHLSESLWNDALKKMVDSGLNMVVIDLGDAVQYNSHPEIAVNNAWTNSRLKNELFKIRDMGLEPIPKLNFSHDAWLGAYDRSKTTVSPEKYYDVCRDLIDEVINLFNKPRFFHLVKDEEFGAFLSTYASDPHHHLYWADFYFLIGEVTKRGSRPWVWQDYIRYYPEKFARMMPKYVIQSNWYNGIDLAKPKTDWANRSVHAYIDIETYGYDQVPGGSNYYENTDECFLNNVKYCTENVADQRLLGFIQSPWKFTVEENRAHILRSIELAGEAKRWFVDNHR